MIGVAASAFACGGAVMPDVDGSTEDATVDASADAIQDVSTDIDPDSGICCDTKFGPVECRADASLFTHKCAPNEVCQGCRGAPGFFCCPK